MKCGEQVVYEKEKSLQNFGSDEEDIQYILSYL